MAIDNLKWNGRSYGGKFGNKCFEILLRVGRLPAYMLMSVVALFFLFFRREQCAESSSYLTRCFGRKIKPISWLAYKHLFSFGMSIIDKYAYFSGADIECVDECKSVINSALEGGKGAVVIVSHIGGWAISGGKLAEYDCPTGVIGISSEHAYINEMMNKNRKRKEPQMIASADDAFSVVSAMALLRKNGVLAVHGDRYVAGKFATAKVLDSEVRLPVSAYALASKSSAPVINVFCVREKVGKYRMFCSSPFYLQNLRGEALLSEFQKATDFYAKNLNSVLKKYPLQWYNFYPFWQQ